MKRIFNIAGVAFLLLAVAGAESLIAQSGGTRTRRYDPKTETTISGIVTKIERSSYGNRQGMGLHLTVKTDNETTDVRLGPAAFVEKTMTFKEGDAVQVVGSKTVVMGKPVVIAREVTKGNQTLKLRDDRGIPLWSRARRGGPPIS